MKPFSTYPEDRAKLLALCAKIGAAKDSDTVWYAGHALADLVRAILEDEAGVGESAPLKIEAGKFYKTRDGRKIGPLKNSSCNEYWPFNCGDYFFKRDGFSCPGFADRHKDADDLTAEWPLSPETAQEDRT